MEASNLLAAAKLLNVDPDWLATGVGLKRRRTSAQENYRQERIEHTLKVMQEMPDYQLDKAVRIIETLADPEPQDEDGADSPRP